MSMDLRRFIDGWEFEPDQITVRKIEGDNGSIKIQMRIDLGLLQMEISGRPDGTRPHGCESLLHYHEQRLAEYAENNGTERGFELGFEQCAALREETIQYYNRYLCEFVLEDFAAVARDTEHNLKVLDLCRRFGQKEEDQVVLEQHRPYLLMMNARAKAHVAIRTGKFQTALATVEGALTQIKEVLKEQDKEDEYGESTEVRILNALRGEIAEKNPPPRRGGLDTKRGKPPMQPGSLPPGTSDPLSVLKNELQRCLDEQRFEAAAVLRDRIRALGGDV